MATSTYPRYGDLQIRIQGETEAGYPVEMTLDWMQELQRGFLDASIIPWVPTADPAADGERLFRHLTAGKELTAAWT